MISNVLFRIRNWVRGSVHQACFSTTSVAPVRLHQHPQRSASRRCRCSGNIFKRVLLQFFSKSYLEIKIMSIWLYHFKSWDPIFFAKRIVIMNPSLRLNFVFFISLSFPRVLSLWRCYPVLVWSTTSAVFATSLSPPPRTSPSGSEPSRQPSSSSSRTVIQPPENRIPTKGTI